MNPSNELRINTLLRALSDVVMPSIRDDAPLAKEQLGLVMAHLGAMQVQAGREREVSARHDALTRKLATELYPHAQCDGALHVEADALRSAMDSNDCLAMSFAIEGLLASTRAGKAFKTASASIVLANESEQNLLGRRWFLPMGFDSYPEQLPELDVLLAAD